MDEPLARAIADRRTGIGCDQLIVLEPSNVADLRMRIWNHDGIEVESCGNASRCVVALTHAKTIETGGGMVTGTEHGSDIEVTLGEPRFEWDESRSPMRCRRTRMPMAWGELQHPVALNVGNPHVVFFVENADRIDLDELGPRIEHDPVFPERINVNVAEIHVGRHPPARPGSAAPASPGLRHRRQRDRGRGDPHQARPVAGEGRRCPAASLTIAWEPGKPIRMRGGATHVFKGEIDLEALR